jgi:hypothetical protein
MSFVSDTYGDELDKEIAESRAKSFYRKTENLQALASGCLSH